MRDPIDSAIDALGTVKVAVVGDLILDGYLEGTVNRISPEAPVPVIQVNSERHTPGGAANVAMNLASLGARACIVGLIGGDAAGAELTSLLRADGRINCDELIVDERMSTTRKVRIIGAHQQVVRLDHETNALADETVEERLILAAQRAIAACDVIVLSDYGKGVASPKLISSVIARARQTGKILLVDPKRRSFEAYRGATILTPNRKELQDATALRCETDDDIVVAAAAARQQCDADILVTRSEKGMSFVPAHGVATHLPTMAQEVFDVSGAGDTVVAMMAAALGAKLSVVEAMRLANHAAGIVVSKVGTACISVEELRASLPRSMPDDVVDGRLMSLDAVIAVREDWRRDKLVVGVANGCFDLLHPGHIALIEGAAAKCDRLIVALNSDASVARLKGVTRPIQPQIDRARTIGAVKGVAATVIFEEETPEALIKSLDADVLFKGSDYKVEDIAGADYVIARGGRVVLIEIIDGHSTTGMISNSQRNAALIAN